MDQWEEDGGAREARGTTVLAKRVHTSPGTLSPPAGGSRQIDNPRSRERGNLCQQVPRGRPTRRGWGGGEWAGVRWWRVSATAQHGPLAPWP